MEPAGRLVALLALCSCYLVAMLPVGALNGDEFGHSEAMAINGSAGNETKLIAAVNTSGLDLSTTHLALPPEAEKADDPIKVFIGYYVKSVGALDQQSMTYAMDIYFRMSWTNPKAAIGNRSAVVTLKPGVAKDMWLPDIYFINEKEAEYHTIVQPSAAVYLAPDGTIAWSIRITMKLSCSLNLRMYPLDKQVLSLQIGSYVLPTDVMEIAWFNDEPIELAPNLGMADFSVTGVDAHYCDGKFKYIVSEHGSERGSFSCLEGKLYLERYIRYYLVKDIFPQALIVMTSWVSFWIDKYAVPARIALSFTTLLTITTMGGNMYATLPHVSYSKAIDYWYGACLVFVVCALVEYAAVNDSLRRGRRYLEISTGGAGRRRRTDLVDRFKEDWEEDEEEENGCGTRAPRTVVVLKTPYDPVSAHFGKLSDTNKNRATLIDKVSRVAFPIAFAVFCFFFWLILLIE